MAVTNISSCRKQAGRESNRYRFHLVLFLFYSIYNSRPGVTLVADHINAALKLCSQSLVFKDNVFIITLFPSQPCIIKQFLLDLVFGIPYFLELNSWGQLLLFFWHQKRAIIRGRLLFQILLTRSHALNICSIFPLNKKIITSDKITLAFKVFQIWFLD